MSKTTATVAAPVASAPTMNLFLRRFPADLHRNLKVAAAQNGRDLREEVVARLAASLKVAK